MPVTIHWDDEAEKTTLVWSYDGKWTWAEVSAAFEKSNELMTSVQHPVSIIHDLTHSAGIPSGALTQAHRFTAGLPDNWDLSLVVGTGAFTETLVNVFSKVYKKLGEHYKAARTMEEARAYISKQGRKSEEKK